MKILKHGRKLLLGTSLALALLVVPNDNVVIIEEQFSPTLVASVEEQINDSLYEGHQLLIITSPGGQVASKEIISEMLKGKTVDSYVNKFAASAAADTAFEVNGTIYVEPDSMILFHGAHIPLMDGSTIGQRDLEKMLTDPMLTEDERIQIEFTLAMLRQINERSVDALIKRHPNVNRDILLHQVFQNFERDKFVTGKVLKDLGFDIVLGAPDISEYKTKSLLNILIDKIISNTVLGSLFK